MSESWAHDGAVLRQRRTDAGFSLDELSERVRFDKGYLSKVENGKRPLSIGLAQACDAALGTDGELTARARVVARGRSAAPPVAQLPAAPSTLVGRGEPLRWLDGVFSEHADRPGAVPVVCVDGPPGVGKTALTLRYAHSIADRFPGGCLFTNLRGYGSDAEPADPGEILGEFLRALGVPPGSIPLNLAERATAFRSVLHGRGVLVVLDNAADSAQVQPLLPGSADCAALVTSRQRLTGLLLSPAPASCVTLDPLNRDDARELLRSVIGAERAAREPEAVSAIADLCGNLPLALRVAAVRVTARPDHAITDLAADLAAESRRLDTLAAGRGEKGLSVRGVFSWSYEALASDAAHLFRCLGLHPGTTFSAGAASALIGAPLPRTRELLDVVSDAHLVERIGRDRYRLHDLLRVYAAELAREPDHDTEYRAAVRRLVEWYLASSDAAVRILTPARPHPPVPPPGPAVGVVEFAATDYDRALTWCDTELSGLVAITRLAADHQLHAHAWRLPTTWLDYFLIRQPWDEWISAHELGVQAARAAGDDVGYSTTLINLGEVHRRRGEFDVARPLFELALSISPDPSTESGWAHAGLAFTHFDQGNFRETVTHLRQMADTFAEIDHRFGLGTALANLGDAYRELGELDDAWAVGHRAYALYAELDDRQVEGYALTRLARTAHARGEPERALTYCDQAFTATREAGDRWTEADAWEIRGTVLLETGDPQAADEALTTALNLFDGLDERRAGRIRALLYGFEDPLRD